MNARHLIPVRVFLLVCALASFIVGDRGMVLCIAPDGHVAIEADREGCCEASAASLPGDPRTITQAAESCCGPCEDVPFGPSTLIAAGGSRNDVHPPECDAPFVLSAGAGLVSDGALPASSGARSRNTIRHTPPGLRTVLRC